MTDQEQLSTEQKELVAVGASVGAGCRPCVSHHLKAGAKAGLNGDRLLAAVTSAERVAAEAAAGIGDHARRALGPDATSAPLSPLEEALALFGAALGANDVANIERHLRAAAEQGASRRQLQQAIETAHTVQENAARIHLREAERLLNAVQPANADAEVPETDAAKPVAGTAGPSMAARFGSSGVCEVMAGRGGMFERLMGASAPAETEAPAATTAAGRCKEAEQ